MACFLFSLNLFVWHLPVFYEAALNNRFLHNMEHLAFLVMSLIMWWPLVSPLKDKRTSYPIQLLYLLALVLGQLPVFLYVTFSQEVLYPTYRLAERITDISPLVDQQLGGVIMKLVGMTFSSVSFLLIFLRWAKKEDTEMELAQAQRS